MVRADTHSIHTFSNNGDLFTVNLQYYFNPQCKLTLRQTWLNEKWLAKRGDSINRIPKEHKVFAYGLLALRYDFD
jgi:hypothetical protein